VPAPPEVDAVSGEETGGLPKRRRGETLASAPRPAVATTRTATSRPSDTAAKFSTFREAIQTGRTTPADRPEDAQHDAAHDDT
jgi:hypothetical protein